MASAISQSSVATVVEDLVSDRSIPLKVCMIILNSAQLISCWIAVVFFIQSYDVWSTLELTLSLSLLLVGNYLIPCIANAVIYCRRWKRSSVSHRKHIEEENKQAWVFLRIALSLAGIPTVGRYIETIIVSMKLNDLEKKHMKDSVVSHREGIQLNPIGTSRLGSTVNHLKSGYMARTNSVISGLSHASSNGVPENSQRKVRKARRQYKRCEHDGALVALIAGSVGAGPMAIGLGFLYFQRDEVRLMPTNQMVAVFSSFALNLLWLAATLTHFYPARHVLSEAEFERGIRPSQFWAIVLLYASHLVQVTLRVLCFVIFVNWFYAFVCIPIIFHWFLGTILFIGYRGYMKSNTIGRPLGERARKATGSFFSSLFFGYVGIFDFVNGNEGKTRLRYLIYYTFYYIENIIMLVVWILRNPTTQIRYPIPFVCCVLALFWLGFILFQIYLYYFSYSPYGTSIIGLCSKKKSRKENFAVEVREPVFGIPIAQSAVPFWKQNQEGSHMTGSRISGDSGFRSSNIKSSRPVAPDHRKPLSIISSQSPKHTPSIFSQPSSQIDFVQDKPRQNPIIKPPPVILQKEKKANLKAQIKSEDLSSDSSSSSNEGLSVFSPKIVQITQSQPDISRKLSDSNSSTTAPVTSLNTLETLNKPIDRDGKFKAVPSYYPEPRSNSRSLDCFRPMIPAAQPTQTTRRIGTGPMPVKVHGTVRPLPSKEKLRNLKNRKDPRSLPPRPHENRRRN